MAFISLTGVRGRCVEGTGLVLEWGRVGVGNRPGGMGLSGFGMCATWSR